MAQGQSLDILRSDGSVLAAMDHLSVAQQREAIAWRAYTIARGATRRAETKVRRLEGEFGIRRHAGRRS